MHICAVAGVTRLQDSGGSAGQVASLAALPPAGARPGRRNSSSTLGIGDAVARKMQANRSSMYPDSVYSDSEWGD